MMMLEQDPELRQLHAWWRARAGPGSLPVLSHLEEIELLNSGCVSLVEVGHEPREFRFRLVSPRLTALLGYEVSGKTTAAIPEPAARAYVEELYERAVRTREPVYDVGERVLDGRRWSHRALVLPLSSEGTAVDRLLICRVAVPPEPVLPPSDAARQSRPRR